jgi:hypothetical protein
MGWERPARAGGPAIPNGSAEPLGNHATGELGGEKA